MSIIENLVSSGARVSIVRNGHAGTGEATFSTDGDIVDFIVRLYAHLMEVSSPERIPMGWFNGGEIHYRINQSKFVIREDGSIHFWQEGERIAIYPKKKENHGVVVLQKKQNDSAEFYPAS